jgi:2-polyprenyl-3-methyl-5-hydroxy-6-metoxy-1,4-benzoquinol methylase
MAKQNEIDYINRVAEVENVTVEQFNDYLIRKPYSDARCGDYLMDIAQVMKLIPAPPSRLLDVGVGSGWTSELFARRGYDVVGLDISPDMIRLANARTRPNLSFRVCDYEKDTIPTGFHVAVIYDSLHHSENTFAVLHNIFNALVDGGVLITVEPGVGHSQTADSIEVMRKYGTTEKDMPASLQRELMKRAGFGQITQHVRLSLLPIEDIGTLPGAMNQVRHKISLAYESSMGMTSIVVAKKGPPGHSISTNDKSISAALLSLAAAHDAQVKSVPEVLRRSLRWLLGGRRKSG